MFGSTYSKGDLSPERYEEVTGIKVTGSTLDPTKGQKMLEDIKRSEHAAMVLKSLSESASDAAASAGRASSQAAFYDALSKAAKNQNAAIASANASYMENVQHGINLAKRGIIPGSVETTDDVIQSAAEGYGKSMTDENYNLPEVKVKSDFGKYLLIGGGVLLAIYLLRGKKKNA
jgi:hypothetical protein